MTTMIPRLIEDAISDLETRPSFSVKRRFGEEVSELRHRLNLTQDAFADRFGLPLANVRNWEQEGRSTTPDSASRLIIEMIKADADKVAEIVAKAKRSGRLAKKKAAG